MAAIRIYIFLFFWPLASFAAEERWVADGCIGIVEWPERVFSCNLVAGSAIEWCSAIGGGELGLRQIELQMPPFDHYGKCSYSFRRPKVGGVTQHTKRDLFGPPKKCPSGSALTDFGVCAEPIVKKNRCSVGNPIDVGSASKIQSESDVAIRVGSESIELSRFYSSERTNGEVGHDSSINSWFFTFNDRLVYTKVVRGAPGANINHLITWQRGDGVKVYFFGEDINALVPSDKYVTYIAPLVADSPTSGWIIRDQDRNEYSFNATGLLISYRKGDTYKIDFIHSPMNDFTQAYVGSRLLFTYERDLSKTSIIKKLILPGSIVYGYKYDGLLNLTEIMFPDGQVKYYKYEDVSYPRALTGITDEKGVRFATWRYDGQGRAISSEHSDGAEKTTLTYNPDGSIRVVNILGKATTYFFEDFLGSKRVTKVTGEPTANCLGANQLYSYNAAGQLDTQTDWNGNVTKFTYDNQNREISRTEAFGTAQASTTQTCWHATLNKPERIIEPEHILHYSYDANGNTLQSTRKPRPQGTVTCLTAL